MKEKNRSSKTKTVFIFEEASVRVYDWGLSRFMQTITVYNYWPAPLLIRVKKNYKHYHECTTIYLYFCSFLLLQAPLPLVQFLTYLLPDKHSVQLDPNVKTFQLCNLLTRLVELKNPQPASVQVDNMSLCWWQCRQCHWHCQIKIELNYLIIDQLIMFGYELWLWMMLPYFQFISFQVLLTFKV